LTKWANLRYEYLYENAACGPSKGVWFHPH
jgi:hypothetical protein